MSELRNKQIEWATAVIEQDAEGDSIGSAAKIILCELAAANKALAEAKLAADITMTAFDTLEEKFKAACLTNPIGLLNNICAALEKQKNDNPYLAEAWDQLMAENDELRVAKKKAEIEAAALQKDYNELIIQVGNCHLGETRHETALRYIKNAEKRSSTQEAVANSIKEKK